jgi:hypothetical protein
LKNFFVGGKFPIFAAGPAPLCITLKEAFPGVHSGYRNFANKTLASRSFATGENPGIYWRKSYWRKSYWRKSESPFIRFLKETYPIEQGVTEPRKARKDSCLYLRMWVRVRWVHSKINAETSDLNRVLCVLQKAKRDIHFVFYLLKNRINHTLKFWNWS